jgi:Asparagine synthase
MLGDANLHRTDRMTMAHGLEARVPFLDTEFTRLVMSIDPAKKMVDPAAVRGNSRGREKTLLRELFEGPNANGHSIPRPVLWRAKAMQCEGVGQDWVSILQRRVSSLVSDAELKEAGKTYPVNTPHTKEELYYRRIYDEHFHGMENVVKLWVGGGRAMGAEWKSDMYTREGLKDVNLLTHSLQQARAFSTSSSMGRPSLLGNKPSALPSRSSKRSFATVPNMDGQYATSTSTCVLAAEEARSAAKACGYNDFESWLTTGGDDRSLINTATGTNKYHIRPQPIDPQHIFRGSCTGNPPTVRGYQAAQKLFNDHLNGLEGEELDLMLRDLFAEQRSRIANLLELPEGTEVILCPSGSDAEYIPLLIAKTLHPNARITNGVTQLREVGAGTAPASVGKYFSTHAPLIGKISDMESLEGFEGIAGVTISAREKNGDVVNASAEMNEFAQTALRTGHFPIVHGVFGGKTGLRDATMPPSLNAGDTSLGVVDACQGRFSLDELHEWLDQDSLVLFTASKFYQAPPFCGAVLVPPKIAEKLRQSSAPTPHDVFSEDGIGGFLTDKELPRSLKSWKPLLRKSAANNIGLALRMEAGLAGMEALAVVPDNVRTAAVEKWASSLADAVRACPDLDPWCVERSIVSIRVAKQGQEVTSWLNMTELRHLYRWMSLDVSNAVPDASAKEKKALSVPAYIGQPVDVSESHAIVRIALGVDALLAYLEDEEEALAQDRLTVQKLAAIAKHFETLKKSGL